jgi:hypothetical protein
MVLPRIVSSLSIHVEIRDGGKANLVRAVGEVHANDIETGYRGS